MDSSHGRTGRIRLALGLALVIAIVGCGDAGEPGIITSDDAALRLLSSSGDATAPHRPGRLIGTTNNAGGVNGQPAGTGTVLQIDPATGQATQIAVLGEIGASLGFSPYTGQLYAALQLAFGRSQLVILDPETGATTVIGDIRDANDPTVPYGVAAMAFDDRHQLWGVVGGLAPAKLLRIDPATGLATPIGSLGITIGNNGGAIADGVFYMLAQLRGHDDEVHLFTVDLTTGAAAQVGGTGVEDLGVALSVGPGGGLLGAINRTLYSIDSATGAATPVGDIGYLYVSGLAYVDAVAAACPCGASWKNGGAYMQCVVDAAADFEADGLLSRRDAGLIRAEAARSGCGR